MSFLNPLMLLGVLAVSAPIAIHLLSRFRPKPMDFGAMELLRRAMVTRSRQVKLEDLLLLLLRCLAIALLALAMARPTLTGAGARLAGGAGQAAAVIGLDGSMSMGHTPGLNSRFDRGVDQVRTILETLEPGAPLSLVLMGDVPQVLHEGRYDPQQIETLLENLEPRPQRLNVARSLDVLAEQLDRLESGAKELYIVSDMQAEHFAEAPGAVREQLATLDEQAVLLLLSVGDERHENLAIDALEFASGSLRAGGSARYRAQVRNTGSEARYDVAVQLQRAGTPVGSTTLDVIEPGATATASFLVPMDEAGTHRLTAQLERDELEADNTAYAVAEVRERVQVLIVSGRRGDHWSRDAGGFVARALQPRGDLAVGEGASLAVRLVDWMDLAVQNLAEYDAIVMADVPDVAEPQVRSLGRFVEAGGGLVFIVGDQTEAMLFNARLAAGDEPLSPATLGEQREMDAETEGGWPLRLAAPTHALARPLAGLPAELLADALVNRHWLAEPVAGAQVVFALGDADGEDDGGDGEDEASASAPLLIERELGSGRVLLMTSAAERGWGEWVIHPAWPILWQQMVAHLTQPTVGDARVSQPLVVSLDPSATIEQVRFTGPREQQAVLSPQTRDGRPLAELERPEWPGFYELSIERGDGDALPAGGVVRAVNVDTRDSNVRALDHEALAAAWPEVAGAIVVPGRDVGEAIRQARVGVELWWPLLLLGLIVLVVEAVLARRFTGRMAAGEQTAPRRRLHVARWIGRRLTTRQAA